LSERLRTFISIDVEEKELLDEIERIQGALLASNARIKPVERENIHLTIRFLGVIPMTIVNEVINIMKRIKFAPFTMTIEHLGAFPERSTRPRVIWLGVTEGAEEVSKIHEQIERELRTIGFPKDRERFVPHITIARVKRSNPKLIRVINEMRNIKVGSMSVKYIRLKKSILTSRGPIYETLFETKATEV